MNAIFFHYPYILWHTVFIIIPSIILWALFWKYFIQYKKTLLFIIIFGFLSGVFSETIGVYLHLWYYNPHFHIGPFFLGLPVGEYFFCLFAPQELAIIFLLMRRVYGKI